MPDVVETRAILAAFFERDDIRRPMARLRSYLPAGAALWVIGGAPRNALIEAIHGCSPLTEDIDVFIAGVKAAPDLARLGLAGERRRTELGGIRWFAPDSPFSFDIGVLSEFIIIKKFRLPPTPQTLLGAIDFDVNAVMWNWDEARVMSNGCLAAISRRVMDFNTTRVFDPVLLAYRILVTRHKTGFSVSRGIFAYLKKTLDLAKLEKLEAMLNAKLGRPLAKAVMEDCDVICTCRRYADHLAWVSAGRATTDRSDPRHGPHG